MDFCILIFDRSFFMANHLKQSSSTMFLEHAGLVALNQAVIKAAAGHQASGKPQSTIVMIPRLAIDFGARPADIDDRK